MGELSSIILAGGKSTRMGFDKQLLKIEDELIVKYLGKILKNHFKEVVVVTNTPELYHGEKFILTKDIYPGLGPLAGIHAGLEKITTKGAFVIACDMPNISEEFIEHIKSLFFEKKVKGVVSKVNGFIEPMNGIYSKVLFEDLENRLKSRNLKLKNLIDDNNFYIIEEEKIRNMEMGFEIFRNINDKIELDNYLKRKA
ncbi:MAG: molybdenum cofactor guanylyltransferase [Tissierellia bacterium]|jgi:molybdopterin-guanine dinucleotide biosynthesis protein A|nr:molybdenum cofactor guanylyltransferase [Tissierellia bacterium]